MRMHRRCWLVVAAAVVGCASSAGWGQGCEPQWLPGTQSQAIYGTANALLAFDTDGDGPLGTWLLAGGTQLAPFGMPTRGLQAFDGMRWRSLAGSENLTGSVSALAVYNGQLIAGGSTEIPSSIARWDGTAWLPLGAGVQGSVRAMEVYNGSLYVGGVFPTVGSGIASTNIARWDGTAWNSVATNLASVEPVMALRAFRNSLYVGGSFDNISGVAATNLAAWNGSSWATAGQPNATVRDIEQFRGLALTQDRLFVGGDFSVIGGQTVDRVAIWNPSTTTWTAAGTPPINDFRDLFVRSTGVSSYQLSGVFGGTPATFSSGMWTALGDGGGGRGQRIGVFNGQYVIARTSDSYLETGSSVQTWNGSYWSGLGVGAPSVMMCLDETGNGGLVGGWYSTQYGTGHSNNYIGVRAGGSDAWTVLGGKVQQPASPTSDYLVKALARMPNGDIVAGGRFAGIGSVASPWLARWDGAAWSPMGTNFNSIVYALQVMPNGDLVAAGTFTANAAGPGMSGIARWNGTAWMSMGGGVPSGYVVALALAANGDLIVGGRFTSIGSPAVPAVNVARWNGTSWAGMGFTLDLPGTNDYVWKLATLADGRIGAVMHSQPSASTYGSYVYVWNGTTWVAIADSGEQQSLFYYNIAALADGSLVTGGLFTSIEGVTSSSIARWDGAWHRMGSIGVNQTGIAPTGGPTALVYELLTAQSGALLVGGEFSHADTLASGYLATWGVPHGCPVCDSIDFNNDGSLFDIQDIDAFFSAFSEGPCIPAGAACNDVDFNNDGSLFDPCDIDSFLLVFSEGPCTLCGE